MNLRQAFRSKIKDVLHGGDHHGYQPGTNGQETSQQETEPTAVKLTQSLSVESSEMDGVSDATSSCQSSDMDVFEIQLNQLQEHLVAAMLENQRLSRELKGYKESQETVRLLGELESEKERNRKLEDELRQTTRNNHSPSQTVGDGAEKSGELVESGDVHESGVNPRSSGWRERLVNWITHVFYNVISDFTDDPEPVVDRNTHDLTVKRLKESIMRFKSATSPIFETVSNVSAMFNWRNPAFSFLAFLMYMYLVWTGYLLPILLFLAIVRLGANNLRERGWNVNMVYLPSASPETPAKDSEEISSVSDKVTIVLQVAKTVQNTLSSIADNLEKINSLLTWKHPGATRYLLTGLCVALLLSAVLPATVFFRLAGLYLGIKLFIIDTVYGRFPRLRQRRDTVYKYWQQLPTERELDHDRLTAAGDVVTPRGHSSQMLHQSSDDGRTFCESFFLPLNEKPVEEWRSGWRCIHIDRNKSLTAAIKPGKLYLTHSFLCFARHNPQPTTNIKIRLADITRIKKVKPYAWMPGKGKSIEITVIDCEKPYLFGAIFGRDDCYRSIMCHGSQTNFPWAADDPNTTPMSTGSSHTHRHKTSESSVSPRTFRLSELRSEDEQEHKDKDKKDEDDNLFYIGHEL